MKKRLLPREYTYTIDNTIGALICIFVLFMFLVIVNQTSHPIEISLWAKVAVPIIVFDVLLILKDFYKVNQVRKQLRQRDMLMEHKPVEGKIEEIKRMRLNRRGELTNSVDSYSRVVYQLVVNYFDPRDDQRKTAISEYYTENLFTCLADDKVDVYILGNNGYVLIDGLHIRKFGEEKIAIGNDKTSLKNSDISFYMDIYGKLIFSILAVIAILLTAAVFYLINNFLSR